MKSKFVLINENIVPESEAAIYINDLSIQRGYGIFDFFKLVDGRPVFLDDHLTRFFNSARLMKLPVSHSSARLKELLYSLIEKNDLPDSGVRMTLTGGYSADGFNMATPNLIITQQKFYVNKESALTGTRLVTYSHQRQFAEAKTIDYLMAIWLKDYISEKKAEDVLYQQNGIIAECPRANIFIVSPEGRLCTPGENILKGVIRKQVLGLAEEHFPVEERDITLEDVYNAKEVFITSSTKNIMPVIEVDGHLIGDGRPGDSTKVLQEELSKAIFRSVSEPINWI